MLVPFIQYRCNQCGAVWNYDRKCICESSVREELTSEAMQKHFSEWANMIQKEDTQLINERIRKMKEWQLTDRWEKNIIIRSIQGGLEVEKKLENLQRHIDDAQIRIRICQKILLGRP